MASIVFTREKPLTITHTKKKKRCYTFKEAFEVKANFLISYSEKYSAFVQNCFCNGKHLSYLQY